MINPTDDGLSDRQLKISYWYITHKLSLRRLLAVVLSLAIFLLLFYTVWQLTFYLINYQASQERLNQLVFGGNQYLEAVENNKPATLGFSPVSSLAVGQGHYDYLVQANNPNPDWLVTFDYRLVGSSQFKPTFVLPGETKYLMDIASSNVAGALEVVNLQWQRFNDYDALAGERLSFSVANDSFQAGEDSGAPSRLTFDLTNNSPYGYWEVGVSALLYNGGSIIGINHVVLPQVQAGETRSVQLNWPERLLRVNSFKILPEVNILDENNIMSLPANQTY